MHPQTAPPVVLWPLVGTAVIWVVMELRRSLKHRPEGGKANWRNELLFRLAVVAGALGAVAPSHVAPVATIRPAAVAGWIGLVVVCAGATLRIWSFHTLGRYFIFIVQASHDQPVITNGPYRVIRHPSYAGSFWSSLGWGRSTSVTPTVTMRPPTSGWFPSSGD